ncbi:MAG: IMPACT family protein [Chitinophagales bacterium]|nr:IMPACT family protein [Chitinophagales bacterium]MCZ2394738.1 IMPACT family protein [Chitinophagales bacterium]
MSSLFSYQTIASATTSIIKEKGSKFYGFAFPVQNENEIKLHLDTIKNTHPKATHHCYAWRIGADKQNFRVNDDGEPSGTAGLPILGQIDAFGICNCLVVSVRYFGGTKLGVSGLISAYKTSAKTTISQAEILTRLFYHSYSIKSDYAILNKAYQFIQEYEGNIVEQNLGDNCTIIVEIPLKNTDKLNQTISNYYPLIITPLTK